MITSTSNPKFKYATELRESRVRRREQRFLIDGTREIERAIKSRIEIELVYVDAEQTGQTLQATITESLRNDNVEIIEVSATLFSRITFGDRNEGIIAVAKTPEKTLNKLTLPSSPLIAVLECIEKPGNVGAVFRSADGAGLDAVIIASPVCDLFHPATIRASMGTLFALQSAVADSKEVIEWLDERRITIATGCCDATKLYTDYDFKQPTAIVLGSESNGLTKQWKSKNTEQIKIPMQGIADSLNISTAAAVLFYTATAIRTTNLFHNTNPIS
jgi:TrmH family RNA methyltransferase